MDIKAVKGMHDLFRPEIELWKQVESRMERVFRQFGYGEIRTPVLEKLEVFSKTVGDETDIVEKQMYQVQAGDEKLVLRPEETAACMRSIIEHQLHKTNKPERLYYYLPMFRHERPQKGRQRQFFQIGAELINDPTPGADAEIIALLDHFYKELGISEYQIEINSVGCNDCRPAYKELLKDYFRPHLASLCEQCQKRFERSPLRILDCKKDSCKALVQGAPKILDHLCENCQTHHAALKVHLTSLGITFKEDPSIVRGLDYYSRTAFEFSSNLLGAQSALAGGGRYDGLSTRFGEAPFPAVGFALGVERLMMVLEQKATLPVTETAPYCYLAALGPEAVQKLYPVAFRLRKQGVTTEMNYDPQKSLKAVLKQADRSLCQFAVIVGERELQDSTAIVKNMKAGSQESIALADIESTLVKQHGRNELAP